MHSHDGFTQLTFHYLDGHTESFTIYEPLDPAATKQEVGQGVRRILDKPWWILQLAEETIFINMANIAKIEVKPPIGELRGEEVFAEVQRVTALTRGASR